MALTKVRNKGQRERGINFENLPPAPFASARHPPTPLKGGLLESPLPSPLGKRRGAAALRSPPHHANSA